MPDDQKQELALPSRTPLARQWTAAEIELLLDKKMCKDTHAIMMLVRQNASELNDLSERRKLDMAAFDAFGAEVMQSVGILKTALAAAIARVTELEKRQGRETAKKKTSKKSPKSNDKQPK